MGRKSNLPRPTLKCRTEKLELGAGGPSLKRAGQALNRRAPKQRQLSTVNCFRCGICRAHDLFLFFFRQHTFTHHTCNTFPLSALLGSFQDDLTIVSNFDTLRSLSLSPRRLSSPLQTIPIPPSSKSKMLSRNSTRAASVSDIDDGLLHVPPSVRCCMYAHLCTCVPRQQRRQRQTSLNNHLRTSH